MLFVVLVLIPVFVKAVNLNGFYMEECNLSKQYRSNNNTHVWCCDSCPVGYKSLGKCTFDDRTTKCEKCERGFYLSNPTCGIEKCFKCTPCKEENNVVQIGECAPEHDYVCKPKDGYYCVTGNGGSCTYAKPIIGCPSGYYVHENGTSEHCTDCRMCPRGTFSLGGYQSECESFTDCRQLGMFTVKEGAPDRNCKCGNPPFQWIIMTIFIFSILVNLVCFRLFVIQQNRKMD
ncbi:unknown [Singapore grouper iridovirus]|uniref:TNFR-Cys domain-containing protein n=1 Tax=Singapore grouper iridovirus TaxID=262968 RepID=Q5YFL4_9VIRU|nr:hypothetical protein ORF051L [Singapore grouper iridovirus]AAS18066.1 unknown [Singapore grouper iridovirus]WAU86760.1 hypothetical protein ORF051L [Singapore grouper iridovirus]